MTFSSKAVRPGRLQDMIMVMSCFVTDLTELFDVPVKLAGFFRCPSLVSNWQQIGSYTQMKISCAQRVHMTQQGLCVYC